MVLEYDGESWLTHRVSLTDLDVEEANPGTSISQLLDDLFLRGTERYGRNLVKIGLASNVACQLPFPA